MKAIVRSGFLILLIQQQSNLEDLRNTKALSYLI